MDARKTRNIINIAQCTQWFSLCALWLKKEILACARMTARIALLTLRLP